MNRLHRSLLIGALSLASTPLFAAAAPDRPGGGVDELQDGPRKANFVEACRFSHRAADDPILHPGMPGMSHTHDFFANTTTNAASSLDSLRAGGTTCLDPADTAGYWVPTLTRNGTAVTPLRVTVYYRLARGTEPASVQPFPAGLRVIAGDASAQAPTSLRVARWTCREEDGSASPTPPSCGPDSNLRLSVTFPNCWDGVNLDSADHKSHLAYSRPNPCPASHPVAVPALTVNVLYPINGDPGEISLASGSVYSGHADFFNAWDQSALAAKVARCLNAGIVCGRDRPGRG